MRHNGVVPRLSMQRNRTQAHYYRTFTMPLLDYPPCIVTRRLVFEGGCCQQEPTRTLILHEVRPGYT